MPLISRPVFSAAPSEDIVDDIFEIQRKGFKKKKKTESFGMKENWRKRLDVDGKSWRCGELSGESFHLPSLVHMSLELALISPHAEAERRSTILVSRSLS